MGGEQRWQGRKGERNFKNKERKSKERVVDLWVKKFIEKEEKECMNTISISLTLCATPLNPIL